MECEEVFDKDEIIPNGYNSYESYIDDINDFLNTKLYLLVIFTI